MLERTASWPGRSEQKLNHLRLRKVLIVEDETLIAMLVEDMLTDLGYEVLGPATRLQRALDMARKRARPGPARRQSGQRAILSGRTCRCAKGAFPFIFATGYGSKGLDERSRDEITLQKPFEPHQLGQAIVSVFFRQARLGWVRLA